jgi:hypothetical protein
MGLFGAVTFVNTMPTSYHCVWSVGIGCSLLVGSTGAQATKLYTPTILLTNSMALDKLISCIESHFPQLGNRDVSVCLMGSLWGFKQTTFKSFCPGPGIQLALKYCLWLSVGVSGPKLLSTVHVWVMGSGTCARCLSPEVCSQWMWAWLLMPFPRFWAGTAQGSGRYSFGT